MGKYNGFSAARAAANQKYLTEKVESLTIRVPAGQKAIIKAHAEGQEESLNQFVNRAISETMARDDKNNSDLAE